ncbi:MAG: flagellar hook protein FlgE [Deltaproteobacteria bacterium]|nr:flagellar hook protein FlgE [Deltaproteobacteria bacterium]
MGITTSLYTGASGLQAHGEGISVVGDNIANVSTIGYKSSRAGFDDVLGGTIPGGSRGGAGVRLGGVQTQFTQGTFLSTGASLDLAISGSGMFVLKDATGAELYSRDGRFQLDKTGKLVNTDGLSIQGYTISASGLVAVAPSDLNLGGAQTPPSATTTVNVSANLNADATANPGGAAFDMTSTTTMAQTSNFATSMTVYDSLGNDHRVDVYFRKTGTGAWEWHAMIDGAETASPAATAPERIGTGTLTFDTSGRLNTETPTGVSVTFTGAAAQTISFDFGDAISGGGTGLTGTTQFSSSFNVTAIDQNGFASGSLVDITVDEDGIISGRFSNGQQRDVARLALATFGSEQGLRRNGDALFISSLESGQPLIAAAATGGRGTIASGNLESSNVDIGQELVTLIAYQRAFSANAKTVTTADEMLTEITNIKR